MPKRRRTELEQPLEHAEAAEHRAGVSTSEEVRRKRCARKRGAVDEKDASTGIGEERSGRRAGDPRSDNDSVDVLRGTGVLGQEAILSFEPVQR